MMFNSFMNVPFFTRPDDKVYIVSVDTIDNNGFLERVKSTPKLVERKIIQPKEVAKNEGKTIVKKAIIWLDVELNFFKSSNGSDYIVWQDNYYRVVDLLNRNDSNGYGYRYLLEYMNEDVI